MTDEINILILEDFEPDAELIAREIRKAGVHFRATRVDTREEYICELENNPPEIIISDYSFPSFDGPTALRIAKEYYPDTPFIFVSGTLGEEAAISTLRNGATDYVLKGKIGRLGPAVLRALQEAEDRRKAREAEEALRRSEEKYRVLFNNLNDMVFVHKVVEGSQLSNIIEVNDSTSMVLGYSREELLNMKPRDIGQYDDPVDPVIIDQVKRSGHGSFTGNLVAKDGHLIPVEMNYHEFELGEHKVSLSIARDITKRKQDEEALRKSELEKNTILQTVSELITYQDTEHRIIWANRAICEYYGVLPEEIAGRKCYDIVQGRKEPCSACPIRRSMKSGLVEEEIITNCDGRVMTVRAYPVMDDDSNVTGVVEVASDITYEIEGQKRDRLAASVFENTSDAIVVVNNLGIIESVNPAFLELSGYTQQELTGQNYTIIDFKPIDANIGIDDIRINMEQNGRWNEEIYQRHFDGHLIPASVSISTIKNDDGIPIQYVAILRDITERYKMQHEKEKIQKNTARMERIASIAAMSAGVVHEIAQPVNAIKIIADGMLLCKEMGKELEQDEVMENLQGVSKQVQRIEGIIQHMRSLASASERVDCMPCNINVAFDSAHSMVERRIKSHAIRVEKSLAPDLPEILGHENRLEEIIINLLDNAVHALDVTKEPDKIIFCSTRLENEQVVLEISDNGPGIDDSLMASIFEPFFTTKSAGGMGLGLSIVQSLVTKYGGQINAFKNELGGATFQIRFPIIQTEGD
ncbi:MAG: PAS domain S-box protein [Acidobacteriota bacterium]